MPMRQPSGVQHLETPHGLCERHGETAASKDIPEYVPMGTTAQFHHAGMCGDLHERDIAKRRGVIPVPQVVVCQDGIETKM